MSSISTTTTVSPGFHCPGAPPDSVSRSVADGSALDRTISRSLSLKSFLTTFTRSNESSPCTSERPTLGITGLAAFGWAGERFAASTGYAKMMYEGMREHYGIEVENFKVHAYAEEDHGQMADFLLRQVAQTAGQQRRIRRAIEHVLTLRNARTAALNRWLDDPAALRS